MTPDIYCGIAAHNEAEGIVDCLSSLANQDIDLEMETIICLNGCTDDTERRVDEAKNRFPKLNIRKVHSKKGKSYAQNAIVRRIENKNIPLAFIDADVILDKKCIRTLYEELCNLNQLLVVGAWPVPHKPEGMSLWKRFLYDVLHVRAFYPESEISRHDVSRFKEYVMSNPQPVVNPNFEVRSKTYFHGRIFMMRNAEIFEMPEDKNVADDTFLPNMIHTRFGPGTIRTRYDALVHYKPYLSLREHFKTYRRIFLDKLHLDRRFKEFKESRHYEETKLDWKFILSQELDISMKFLVYSVIRNVEEVCYRLLPKKQISDVWHCENN